MYNVTFNCKKKSVFASVFVLKFIFNHFIWKDQFCVCSIEKSVNSKYDNITISQAHHYQLSVLTTVRSLYQFIDSKNKELQLNYNTTPQ